MTAIPIVQPTLESISQPVADRFWAKVNKIPDGCWLWTADKAKGYGQFWMQGKMHLAHRWSYEQSHGPIPKGLQIDHLCRVRHCVNPDHLEPVTHKENCLRGEQTNVKLHHAGTCKHGHPVNEVNTYFRKSGPRAGEVAYCKLCHYQKRKQHKRE